VFDGIVRAAALARSAAWAHLARIPAARRRNAGVVERPFSWTLRTGMALESFIFDLP
jgi:hypothetical protein